MDFDNENRIISPDLEETDKDIELSLRPHTLNEYIGQEKAKENLKIYIEAAKTRGDVLDHVLLYGPPGLGKTTLAGNCQRDGRTNKSDIRSGNRKTGRPCGSSYKSRRRRRFIY